MNLIVTGVDQLLQNSDKNERPAKVKTFQTYF